MSENSLHLRSHAKLNWYLHVFDPREDGFHDIETVFQELDLADELTFEILRDANECVIDGFPDDVPAETNLITRAWKLMQSAQPGIVRGLRVRVEKNIPRGGGLGGGSSNAACALVALNELYKLHLPLPEIETLGASLGSDVPFFIRGGCAIGRGRGELLESVQAPPAYHLVLTFPTHGISTREAYLRLDQIVSRPKPHHTLETFLRAIATGNPYRLASAISNDFELALKQEKWFHDVISALDHAGSLRSFLCGSGSTVAALGKDHAHCLELSKRLCHILPYTQSVTCTLAFRGAV